MEPAPTIAAFAAAPVGRYVAGPHCVAWCAAPDLVGAAAWDEPEPADVDLLVSSWDGLVRASATAFDKVFDAGHVSRIREDTFARLVGHVRERTPVSRQVRKQVLIAPAGIASAVVHGFWNLVPSRHPWHVTADAAAGFAWLGRPDHHADVAALIDHLRDRDLPTRLRRWLEAHLLDATLPAAAVSLGMSSRRLQRALADAGTSFRDVLRAARLDTARRMLADPAAKIDAVAAAVGWRSTSSFVRMFRETQGETPAAYRDRPR